MSSLFRLFIATLSVFLWVLSSLDAADRPNILLILADDVGQEVFGCYGGESYKTPHIDRLAAEGMKFQHCYSMPACHPTRTALLTGQYPFQVGYPKWGSFPAEQEKETFAFAAKNAGYATSIAGKWQLTILGKELDHPHRLGFEEYALFGWHEGPRYYDPLIWKNGARWGGIEKQYGPDLYAEFLADFIEKNRGKPFLAYYSMALCHDVTDDLQQPVQYGPRGRYDSFAEMVADMDREVGALLTTLDLLNISDNTVVIFTGDNGTPKQSILRHENGKYIREPVFSKIDGRMQQGGKTTLTDWGTRVPLLVRWPKVIQPGQISDALVDMSDFLPTIAELAEYEVPAKWEVSGRSFVPVLRGQSKSVRDWAFSERTDIKLDGKNPANTAWVRTQRWKLYLDGRLIDMDADRDEKHPIGGDTTDAESRQVREMLQAAWDRLLKP